MRVVTADFRLDRAALSRIRFAVFVDEQRVPAELEIDDRDPVCTHVLAFGDDGVAIGTGRIDVDGKIGRVAVVSTARGFGVGRALMEYLHALATERGLPLVWCHAQVSAVPFYERLGYVATGGVFDEAGIDHVCMQKKLDVYPTGD